MQLHALTGFDYLSLNLLDHFGTPPAESKEYLTQLRERKAYYEELHRLTAHKENWGIGIPLPENYVASLRSNRFGLNGTNPYPMLLQKLGLPVCYRETQVNFLWGELVDCYDDEKIKKLLCGGVILDEEAVKTLCSRGFGPLLGVEFGGCVTTACYEQLTQDPLNGSYAADRYPVCTANIHASETCYQLKPLAGARALTELVDATLQPFGAGTVYFENKLGGRVLSFGTVFTGNNWLHKCRRHQLHQAVVALFGQELPFDIVDALYVSPVWYRGENTDVLALYNYSIDDQTFRLAINGEQKELTVSNMSIRILTIPHGRRES